MFRPTSPEPPRDMDVVASLREGLQVALCHRVPTNKVAFTSRKIVLAETQRSADGDTAQWYERLAETCQHIRKRNPNVIRLNFEDLAASPDGRIVVLVTMLWASKENA